MEDSKVILKPDDIYGFEIKSPEFAPEIKVKFAKDISAKTKMGLGTFDESKEEEKVDFMARALVLDWNLYDEAGKLPISYDSLQNKMSANLTNWIMGTIRVFFTQKTTAS